MKEFIAQHFEWIIGIIVVGIFVFRAAKALKKAKKIDREGRETDAVASRILEDWDPDTSSSSYTTYVEYTDENGERRESPMALEARASYAVGERIRIRYNPGDREMVRAVNERK